jgi:hypothetical protein
MMPPAMAAKSVPTTMKVVPRDRGRVCRSSSMMRLVLPSPKRARASMAKYTTASSRPWLVPVDNVEPWLSVKPVTALMTAEKFGGAAQGVAVCRDW